MPSGRRPQVENHPVLTEEKLPAGGVALPNWSLPQQEAEPSCLTPQLWYLPELTERNVPSGGIACGELPAPQQASDPPSLTPQVCSVLALTEANAPSGGEAPSIEINFENHGTPQRETAREVRFDPRGIVVSIVTDDLRRGGPIRQTMAREMGGGAL